MIYNENRLTGLHIRLFFFCFFVFFRFLRIISVSAGGTILIYTSLTLDMFFRVFLLKFTLGFYKHSMSSVIK